MKSILLASTILGVTLLTGQAEAKGHHYHHYRHHYAAAHYSGGRPSAWCGWYMANKLGFVGALGRELWLAANWAHVGTPTSPHVGAVVVWRHHVGQIVGQANGQWLVNSGNDGHAVRTRARSLSGAIAIRDVGSHSVSVASNSYVAHQTIHRHYAALHRRHYVHQYANGQQPWQWQQPQYPQYAAY